MAPKLNYNPNTDIPDQAGKVIFITGGGFPCLVLHGFTPTETY